MTIWTWYRSTFITFDGRLGRRPFLLHSLALLGISIAIAGAGWAMFAFAPPMIALAFFFAGAVLIMIASVSLLVRRFHDLGRPAYTVGAYYLVSMAVIGLEALLKETVSIVAAGVVGLIVGAISIVIVLWPGRPAPNAYGPPPA